jgi:hypothetical protein
MTFLKSVAFAVWLCAFLRPYLANSFLPIRSFVEQQHLLQEHREGPTTCSSSQNENDPWEAISSTRNPNNQTPASQQEPIDTVAVSLQDEKKQLAFPTPPRPQTPQSQVVQSKMTIMSTPTTPSRAAASTDPPRATSQKVVFSSDGGMMFQELLPKAMAKPKRLVPYQSNAFQPDGGIMFEDR